MPPLVNFKRFDVRPLIQRGEEPLAEILRRVRALAPERGLILLAPFLPALMIEGLERQGFRSKIERGEGATWIVYFWPEDGDGGLSTPAQARRRRRTHLL